MSERDRHQRIQELFEDLLDLEPSERAAELLARCPDDDALRASVGELLDADGSSHRIEAARQQVRSAATTQAAPERVGRYTLRGVLGEGSMGIVYEAERESAPRRVALKLLRPGLLDEERIERFEHEARILGLLRHAGIARVFEAGTYEGPDGPLPYLAMELVEGPPLDAFIEKQELGLREIVELVARVGDAVQHAHGQGIVHRDLKPSNILVDAGGRPKVLDFGIARAMGDDVVGRTRSGEILGTLTTMSPEQLSGEPSQIDTRADVYALGAILYRLLGGVWPIDPSGMPIAQALSKLAEEEPLPLSALRWDVDSDLELVVATALQKSKDQRYASVSAFVSDLRRWLAGDAVEARPPSAAYHLRKFARRNRSVVLGAGLVVIALVATIVANNVLRGRADAAEDDARTAIQLSLAAQEQERSAEEKARVELERALEAEAELAREASVAETRAEEAEAAAASARRLANFLINLFHARADGLPTTARDLLHRGAERIDDLADEPELYRQLLQTIGQGKVGIGEPRSAIEYLERALAMHREDGAADGLPEARIILELSSAHSALSDYPTSSEMSRQSLEILRGLADPDPEVLVNALNALATSLQYEGQMEEAEALTDEAIELAEGLSESSLATSQCLRMKAFHLTRQRRYAEAQPLLRESLRLARTLGGEHHPLTANGYNDLGWSCIYLENFSEAREVFERGLELETIVHGADSAHAINASYGLGTAFFELGQLGDALALFDETLQLALEVLGRDAALTAAVRSGYAEALAAAENYEAAKEMWQEALAVDLERFGPTSHEFQYGLGQLGGTHLSLGEYEEAEECYKRSLEIQLELEGISASNVAISLDNLNGLIMRSADPAGAVEFAYELVEHWERGWPNGHLDKGRGYLALGMVLFESGAAEEALPILETACVLLEEYGLHEDLALARGWLGRALLAIDDLEGAEELLLMALDSLRQIPENDIEGRTKCEAALVEVRARLAEEGP